ncbi:MAG: hypothetical protein IOC80_00415 [Rhodobacter sp.]|nr:hypothetical protein [Rhodobacter sp.]MCA3512673.1 hypothetical protein [Rhodobacter sp.]MCA3519881.1 hypothetical protein [Rhodobacter sp.]MCA3523094.1 hypothetical protein [Rhodobacter sp.]MCA3524743.1 hypothetical protein [Rhodobacter sp.]
MRAAPLFCLMALSACAGPAPARTASPVPPAAEDTCGAAGLASLVGQPLSRFNAQARQGPARVIRPGQPVTMDYNPLRLNVLLDADGRMVAFRCG